MSRFCPICKNHDSIIIKRIAKGCRNDKVFEYEEIVYFCPNNPDIYFEPPKVMNENLLSMMKAYENLYPMSASDIAYKEKLERSVSSHD